MDVQEIVFIPSLILACPGVLLSIRKHGLVEKYYYLKEGRPKSKFFEMVKFSNSVEDWVKHSAKISLNNENPELQNLALKIRKIRKLIFLNVSLIIVLFVIVLFLTGQLKFYLNE
jgi:hypothetical protein